VSTVRPRHEGLICPFCETPDPEVLVLQEYRVGTTTLSIFAACADGCGLVFEPPREVREEAARALGINSVDVTHPCRFCGKELRTPGSKSNHERRCKENPERTRGRRPGRRPTGLGTARYLCDGCGKQWVQDDLGENVQCGGCGSLATSRQARFDAGGQRLGEDE